MYVRGDETSYTIQDYVYMIQVTFLNPFSEKHAMKKKKLGKGKKDIKQNKDGHNSLHSCPHPASLQVFHSESKLR